MRKKYCKVCEFFERCKWLRPSFEKRVREGSSLRILQSFLEGQGLKCDTKTISSHVRHMDTQIQQQREIERSLRKKPLKAIQKLREFFKPELPKTSKCEHRKTVQFWDMAKERVFIMCADCSEILGSFDPEEHEKKMARDRRSKVILASLRRKRP